MYDGPCGVDFDEVRYINSKDDSETTQFRATIKRPGRAILVYEMKDFDALLYEVDKLIINYVVKYPLPLVERFI